MNNLDYVIEPTAEGGFSAYFRCNEQCKTYATTIEEVLDKLIALLNGQVDEMYLVEEYN